MTKAITAETQELHTTTSLNCLTVYQIQIAHQIDR
jgi:hypothetical protein